MSKWVMWTDDDAENGAEEEGAVRELDLVEIEREGRWRTLDADTTRMAARDASASDAVGGRDDEYEEPELSKGAVLLSHVRPAEREWLWPGHIPVGAITLLDGDPGLGKSLIALDLIARVTTGRPMPDGTCSIDWPAGVVLLAAEDELGATIVPRLLAAGADMRRVAVLRQAEIYDERTDKVLGYRDVQLPRDEIDVSMAATGVEAVLVVIDPLMSYLEPSINSWRDQDVRAALAPLAEMAQRNSLAVLAVRHLNKAGGSNPLYRGGGSIGFIDAARSGLLVAKSPDDPEHERILAGTKSNLGAPLPSLRYRLRSLDDDDPYSQSVRVEWLGASEHTAASLLSQPTADEEPGAKDEAVAFLRTALREGPRPAAEVEAEAHGLSISKTTLRRARRLIGVETVHKGYSTGSAWLWSLPQPKEVSPASEPASNGEDIPAGTQEGTQATERDAGGGLD